MDASLTEFSEVLKTIRNCLQSGSEKMFWFFGRAKYAIFGMFEYADVYYCSNTLK
jgi:hypothetical protein